MSSSEEIVCRHNPSFRTTRALSNERMTRYFNERFDKRNINVFLVGGGKSGFVKDVFIFERATGYDSDVETFLSGLRSSKHAIGYGRDDNGASSHVILPCSVVASGVKLSARSSRRCADADMGLDDRDAVDDVADDDDVDLVYRASDDDNMAQYDYDDLDEPSDDFEDDTMNGDDGEYMDDYQ